VSFLVDTNVLSELRKRDRCHPGVRRWFAERDDDDLFLSVLTLGEIRGVNRCSMNGGETQLAHLASNRCSANWASAGTSAMSCSGRLLMRCSKTMSGQSQCDLVIVRVLPQP
jgi:hypothetical protein